MGHRVMLRRALQACLEPTPSLELWEVVCVFTGNGAPGGAWMPHNRGRPEQQMFKEKVVVILVFRATLSRSLRAKRHRATSRSAESHISCRAAPTSSFPFPTLFYFLAISSTCFLGSLSLPAALKSSDLGLVGSRWVGQLNKGILSISISLEASMALALGCDNRGIPKTSTAGREGGREDHQLPSPPGTSPVSTHWLKKQSLPKWISSIQHLCSPFLTMGTSPPTQNDGPQSSHSPPCCNNSKGISHWPLPQLDSSVWTKGHGAKSYT